MIPQGKARRDLYRDLLIKRDADVLIHRDPLCNRPPKTLAELATKWGCSRETIRRVEHDGFQKVRRLTRIRGIPFEFDWDHWGLKRG